VDLTVFIIGALAAMFAVVSLLAPVATRLHMPHQTVLALTGVAIGFVSASLGGLALSMGPREASDVVASAFGLKPEAFIYIFLPILLFEMAMGINVRRLMDEIGPVLVLAVVAVVVATAVIGLSLWMASPHGLIVCLLLAAVVSTTDPGAVVAIFRELGAPIRLRVLLEGESLFNDAAAIALFAVLSSLLGQGGKPDALAAVIGFVRMFAGGLAVGFVAAWVTSTAIPLLRGQRTAEITMTVALAYGVFVAGEQIFHVSGVVAVVTAGLVMGSHGRTRVAARNWDGIEEVWGQLGHWANSLVFLLASILVPNLLVDVGWNDLSLLAVVVVGALVARAAVLWGILPLLSIFSPTSRIGHRFKAVILWGGVRGAVTLALALSVTEARYLSPDARHFVGVLSAGFVLFTLLVNAPTLHLLVRWLGLDQLAALDLAVRDRVLALATTEVRAGIERAGREYEVDPSVLAEIERSQADALAVLPRALKGHPEDAGIEPLRVGLIAISSREHHLYMAHFRNRLIGRDMVRKLSAQAGRIHDASKAEGLRGYLAAALRTTKYPSGFRFALWLQQRLGVTRPLAGLLSERYESLLLTRMVLGELVAHTQEQLAVLLGPPTALQIVGILKDRLAGVRKALLALSLQYPDYDRHLQRRFLARIAARLEREQYQELLDQGTISPELFRALQQGAATRWQDLEGGQTLDLGLDKATMIAAMPLFQSLGRSRLRQLSKLLRPELAVPGHLIVRRNQRGDSMYFIASGAVEVTSLESPKQLGSGDFFGELALLLSDGLRTADVVALTYCQLLVLRRRDFQALLETDEELKAQIDVIASARLAEVRPEARGLH
jgi:monovalent cation:H+ antiporter, CPA1 family